MPEVWGEAVAIYKNCAEQPPQLCGGCCVGLLLVGVFPLPYMAYPLDIINSGKAGGLNMIKNRIKEYRAKHDMKLWFLYDNI